MPEAWAPSQDDLIGGERVVGSLAKHLLEKYDAIAPLRESVLPGAPRDRAKRPAEETDARPAQVLLDASVAAAPDRDPPRGGRARRALDLDSRVGRRIRN